MNRSEFWTVIAAVAAGIVLLWTIWSDVAQVRKEIVDIHKTLAAIQVSIADLRTEIIRETSKNREDIGKLGSRIEIIEAAKE